MLVSAQGLVQDVAQAQSASSWSPKYARPEHAFNLFAEWESEIAFDALRIRLPIGWKLLAAERIDRARTTRTPLSLSGHGPSWVAESSGKLSSPVRIVLTVEPDKEERVGSAVLQAIGFIPSEESIKLESVGDPIRMQIPVEAAPATNGHALNLNAARTFLSGFEGARPLFPIASSFSTEFWFQTIDRDVVLLSTWSGDEAGSYPLEVVIDAGGNLRCYSGQNGMHYSVVSDRPISDGSWHHVAYVRDVPARIASLFIDGRPTDSVYLPDSGVENRSYPISIGGRIDNPMSAPTGLFDELRIWTVPRDAAQIAAEMRLPGHSLVNPPTLLLDFESSRAALPEQDQATLSDSDLALHQPVGSARAHVQSGVVEIEWRLAGSEAQTVTLERSIDGNLFVPVYLVATDAGDPQHDRVERRYAFQDVDMANSTVVYYRFTQDFQDGSRLVSSTLKVGLGEPDVPSTFTLVGNSPNPFMTSTQIFFELTESMHVRLSVWDISGHLVEWLVNQTQEAGLHQVVFFPDDLPSGTYFVRMESDHGVATRKMILRK